MHFKGMVCNVTSSLPAPRVRLRGVPQVEVERLLPPVDHAVDTAEVVAAVLGPSGAAGPGDAEQGGVDGSESMGWRRGGKEVRVAFIDH